MPCHQIRIVSVAFKVENIELLKKALEKTKCRITNDEKDRITFMDRYHNRIWIDLNSGKMIANMNDKRLFEFSNQLKRSYSEVVIDELAKKQKWIKKQMGENRYQLQRF